MDRTAALAQITDLATLTSPRTFAEQDVAVGEFGTVRIRALSRAEVLAIRQHGAMPLDVMEQKLLATALITPRMTEEDVAAWQAVSPAGELEPVANAVSRLSGMTASATKEAVARFRG